MGSDDASDVRRRLAVDGIAAPASEGRGLATGDHHRPGWKGRQRPACAAGARGDRIDAGAPGWNTTSLRRRPKSESGGSMAAGRIVAQISEGG